MVNLEKTSPIPKTDIIPHSFSTSVSLITTIKNTVALDFYYEDSDNITIFWVDISSKSINSGRLYKSLLVDVTPIITFGIHTPEGIAVDWIGKNIYWVDSVLDQIFVSDFNGKYVTSILNINITNPRGIAIDSNLGYLFWSDWDLKNPRIERSNMDGSDRKVIYKSEEPVESGWINDVSLDLVSKRIYWVDAKSDKIMTTDYNGNDLKEILKESKFLGHPFGVEVFENHVYWGDWKSFSIYRASKWNGSHIEVVDIRIFGTPFGISIIHPTKQNKVMKNPCKNNGGCSHMCLIKTKTSRTCACPHMMILDYSGTKCVFAKITLFTIKGNDMNMYELESNISIRYPFLNLYDQEIIDFTIDNIRNKTYWIGSKNNNIQGINYAESHTFSKIIGGLNNMKESYVALDVDLVTGLIYYISTSENVTSFNIINPENGINKLLFTNKMYDFIKKPQKLIICNKKEYFLWFDVGYENLRLFKSSLDGRNVEEIKFAVKNLGNIITSVSVDADNKFLIYTNNTKEAFVISLDDKSLRNISFDNNTKINSMLFLEGYTKLIYHNSLNDEIVTMDVDSNFTNIKVIEKINIEMKNNHSNNIMKLIDNRNIISLNEVNTNCKKLRCEHMCIRSNSNLIDRICLCGDGFEEKENGCFLKENIFIGINNKSQVILIDRQNSSAQDMIVKLPFEAHALIPSSIAFDLKLSIYYCIEEKTNDLWMVNFKNNSVKKLLDNAPHGEMTSLAVDPVNNLLYISTLIREDNKRYSMVEYIDPFRVDLRSFIISIKNSIIHKLLIDYKRGILLIITKDFQSNNIIIWSSDLNGSNLKILKGDYKFRNIKKNIFLLSTKSSIIGLNMNYKWESFDYKTLKVYRDKKFIDSTFQRHFISKIENNAFIDIDYASVPITNKWIPVSKCEETNGGCEEICFHKNSEEISCGCVFSKLDVSKKSCETYSAYIAYSLGTQIEFAPIFADVETFSLSNEAFLESASMKKALKTIEATDSINNAHDLTVDMEQKQYIIADYGAHRIVAVKFDGMDNYIISEHVGPVEGVAFDPILRDIYFTSRNTIQKVSLLSTNISEYPINSEIVLKLGKSDKLKGIAIDGCRKMIYYCNYREDFPSIERVTFSGYRREKIIKTNIRSPTFLALDFKAAKLYWIDSATNKVERTDFDGRFREDVLLSGEEINKKYDEEEEVKFIHPSGIAIYENYIYLTDWRHRSVLMIDKITGGRLHTIAKNLYLQPYGLSIVAKDANDCGIDECTMNHNLGCQDVCRLTASGIPHCACNGERVLLPDNKTCTDEYFGRCSKDQFTCASTSTCIPYIDVCDGVKDCQGGEDEFLEFCANRKCRDGYYSCGNGRCVEDALECESIFQCEGNFFDETECPCDPGYIFDPKQRVCALIRIDYRRKEPCGNKTCLNGGICDEKKNICRCPGGISGDSCETDPCYNKCLNKGICTMSTKGSPSPHCDCPIEYHGERCEKLKCAGKCGKNGVCIVDERTGLPYCHCNVGWTGDNCEKSESICNNFCFNNGHCLEAHNHLPYCNCPANYNGVQCENCITRENIPLECKNGGHCVDRRYCECLNGFSGTNCEINVCQFHCFNDGKCFTNSSGIPSCECLPSYTGERCEDSVCDFMEYPCSGNGLCLPIHDKINDKNYTCLCNSRYEGSDCEMKIGVHEYCINSINILPILQDPDEVECECLPGFTGERCEIPEPCTNYCKNNGHCLYDYESGKTSCICLKGTGGPKCEIITARECSDLDCKNGGVCGFSYDKTVECYCPIGWTGFDCSSPSCNDYCQNNGECSIFDNGINATPYCKCKDGWFGVHCTSNLALNPENKNKRIVHIYRGNDNSINELLYLFIYILFGVFITGIIIVSFIYFYKKISILMLFGHRRFHNVTNIGSEMEEFNNEAFMLGEEVFEAPTEEDKINFVNSMRDNVYNDTVFTMSDLDMRLNKQNTVLKPETEELLRINTSDKVIFK
uniref:Low-density lipoprotein receptor-related protein 6 n=1 Tax=Parastrongyloides trichosuri TaxID=131310 RepID=A0A0N4ZXC0_PARTI